MKNEQLHEQLHEVMVIGEKFLIKLIDKHNNLENKERTTAENLCKPEAFNIENIKSFWRIYKSSLDILDKPASLILMRPLMEVAYSNIIYFSTLTLKQQRNTAIEAWLCVHGIMPDEINKKQFQQFVNLLKEKNTQDFYMKLVNEDYPFNSFQKQLNRLLPSPINCKETVEASLDKLWGKKILTKEAIDKLFRWSSMYVHGNFIITTHLNSTRKHTGRVATNMVITGISIILYSMEILSENISEKDNVNELYIKISSNIEKQMDSVT